jgi:hypothetical protein
MVINYKYLCCTDITWHLVWLVQSSPDFVHIFHMPYHTALGYGAIILLSNSFVPEWGG